MKSEKEKMLAGELYDPCDPELEADRAKARGLLRRLNASSEQDVNARAAILAELFGYESDAYIQPPFYCDYGRNIAFGRNVFANFNCVFLDVVGITIGNDVRFGPAVQLYTATHPLVAHERRQGSESGEPIIIGDDVWIGGGAIVCPGVTIGARSVIAAGSVVVRDIPADVLAAGNPCRVVRQLSE